MAILVARSGWFGASPIKLGRHTTLGRLESATIPILASDVSKQHASIRQLGELFVVEDLGSRNGTFLNGGRVRRQELRDGDELRIGPAQFTFRTSSDETTQRDIQLSLIDGPEVFGIDMEAGEFPPVHLVRDDETLRRDYERLRIAHRIARDIGAELDVATLLPKILSRSMELLGADRGIVFLRNEAGELVPTHVQQRGDEGKPLVVSRTALAMVASEKKAVLAADVRTDPRFSKSKSMNAAGVRSSMTVPLLHGDTLLGALHLDSGKPGLKFSTKELEILAVIASQAASAIDVARLARKAEEDARTRAELERLIPPNVVKQIVSGQIPLNRSGNLTKLAVLYADIRGFTAMTARSSPVEIVATLNEFFEMMVEIVFRNRGTVDKFVGDQIIALFGAPVALPKPELVAVHSAVEMQRELKAWNEARAAAGLTPVEVGIGVDAGEVVTGMIGSPKALQYTAIGDAMNSGARLCAAAGPREIIVSQSVSKVVSPFVDLEELPPIDIKAGQGPCPIFRFAGLRLSGERTHG